MHIQDVKKNLYVQNLDPQHFAAQIASNSGKKCESSYKAHLSK